MNATQETFRRMFVFLFYNDWLDITVGGLKVSYVNVMNNRISCLAIKNRFKFPFFKYFYDGLFRPNIDYGLVMVHSTYTTCIAFHGNIYTYMRFRIYKTVLNFMNEIQLTYIFVLRQY